MKELIGQRLLKKLQPQAKPFEVRDTRQDGFILRVQPTGSMSYICEYARGKRITIAKASAIKPEQARDRVAEIISQARGGKDPIAERNKKKAKTLRAFISEDYNPWVEVNRKTGGATAARILNCFDDLMKYSLADLTFWQLDKWITARLKMGIKPETINRDVTSLKAALTKAIEWGMLETHPLSKVKRIKVDSLKRVRFLCAEEEKNLRQALEDRAEVQRIKRDNANTWRVKRGYKPLPSLRSVHYVDHLMPMVLLAMNTGIRRGEMFALKWQDVDFHQAIITIEGGNAKSNSTRHIPLNLEAHKALQCWRDQTKSNGLIFPGKGDEVMDDIKHAWDRLRAEAKLMDFRWHDLRHHFASRLVMMSVPLNTVRELLGHNDINTTLRYVHLAPEHKAAAVAKLMVPNDIQASGLSGAKSQ